MRKPLLGAIVGALLGLFDGVSAWAYPEARSMMATIIAGSTVKGLVTGLASGLIATRTRSTATGVIAGLVIGAALSAIAAAGQPDHYWAIVLPGMLLGAITGYVTQRFGRAAATSATLLVLVALLPAEASAQQPADNLAPVAPLIGRWVGTSEGQPGQGTVERDYERALGSRFVRLRNRSTYAPQEKNPKGETHEDEGFISFDRARKRLVLRQFHVEGFVVTYLQDVEPVAGTISFTSEAIENIPPGFRARETYTMTGPDDLEEVFEMAEPGKEFVLYSRTRLKRVK